MGPKSIQFGFYGTALLIWQYFLFKIVQTSISYFCETLTRSSRIGVDVKSEIATVTRSE